VWQLHEAVVSPRKMTVAQLLRFLSLYGLKRFIPHSIFLYDPFKYFPWSFLYTSSECKILYALAPRFSPLFPVSLTSPGVPNGTITDGPATRFQIYSVSILVKYCDVLVEYQNYRTVVPNEIRKGASAVTNAKLVAVRYSRGNESIIAFQGVTMSDSFAVHIHLLGFYIPEDGILHSHSRENLKSYIPLTGLAL
jgi:hypothetical protein